MMKHGLTICAVASFLMLLACCGSVIADDLVVEDADSLLINRSSMSATPPAVSLANGPANSTFNVTDVYGKNIPADNYTWVINSFPTPRRTDPRYEHRFDTPGCFPVALIAENYTYALAHPGDTAQDTKYLPGDGSIHVTVPIEGRFEHMATNPFRVYFNFSSNNTHWRGIPTRWDWEFFNETNVKIGPTVKKTVPEINFTHAFPVSDVDHTYNVTCRAYNESCFVVDNFTSQFVTVETVDPLIVANFTYTPESCPTFPVEVTFKDNSSGFLKVHKSRDWQFGDGSVNDTQTYPNFNDPHHSYNLPGTYAVNYTVRNESDGFVFQNTTTRYITVDGLFANFTYVMDPPSGEFIPGVGIKVDFTSTSLGYPTYYDWDFDDDAIPSSHIHGRFANHTYTKGGTYNVTLTAWKPCGGAQIFNSTVRSITVMEKLIANYTYAPDAGKYPLTVQFTDTSSDSPLRWQWQFYDKNDGLLAHPIGYSDKQHPTWPYNSPGRYYVSLNVTNERGSTSTKADYITLYDGITADFTADRTFGLSPLLVNFTDISTPAGQATTWKWVFDGVGAGSTIQYPNHTFTQKGNYTISLTASNSQSSDTETKPAYISVGTMITPDFTPSGLIPVRSPFIVNFTDASLPADEVSGWKWTFSDGGSAIGRNVSHQYPGPGVYNVTLNVSSMYDERSVTKAVNITEVKEPLADFIFSPLTVDAGEDEVSFQDRSTGPGLMNWSWRFGDGGVAVDDPHPEYVYPYAGHYYPSLTVTNPYGNNTKNSTIPVSVRGPVIPSFITDKPDWWSVIHQPVTFIDTSKGQPVSWVWDFADGTAPVTITDPQIVHTYTRVGIYNVTMTATNWVGDSKMAFHNFEVTDKDIPRDVNFEAAGKKYSGVHPFTVQFDDQTPSQSNVIEWYWDYGDGSNEFFTTPTSPTHTYTKPGEYTVTLTVRNDKGVNEKIRVAYVVVI